MTKHIWVIRSGRFSGESMASDLKSYIGRYEVIKETPKGYRVKVNYSENGTVMTYEKYDIFQSEKELLEHIADKANKMADVLDKQKLSYTRLLCDAHDALRDLNQK